MNFARVQTSHDRSHFQLSLNNNKSCFLIATNNKLLFDLDSDFGSVQKKYSGSLIYPPPCATFFPFMLLSTNILALIRKLRILLIIIINFCFFSLLILISMRVRFYCNAKMTDGLNESQYESSISLCVSLSRRKCLGQMWLLIVVSIPLKWKLK